MESGWTRRAALGGMLAAAALPPRARAQASGPINIGALVPLSGGGGPFGPEIAGAQKIVIDEVNAAGGVLGRKLALVVEDDQSDPGAGVRAAHKLVDVDQVVAMIGSWASAVCSAVAPVCWESRTMMICIGAADSITQLPHQGYVARTQPSIALQSEQFANFAIAEGAKHLHVMMPQTPFTETIFKAVSDRCTPKGIKLTSVTYDGSKASYRSEVDAMMRAAPDMILAGGYLPDTIVLAKDLYRADYHGKVVGFAYAVNDRLAAGAGKEAAEGFYGVEPTGAAQSGAYKRLIQKLGKEYADIYTCHGYDEANLVVLAMAAAKQASGTAIRDNLRVIGDPAGVKVDNAIDGMAALAAGKTINYLGASGPCKFLPNGDAASATFRYTVIKDGKVETYRTT